MHPGSREPEISITKGCPTCSPQIEPDLLARISFTDFPGSPAERQEVLRILTSYVDVIARDGEDLGHTTTIQHMQYPCQDTRMPASLSNPAKSPDGVQAAPAGATLQRSNCT